MSTSATGRGPTQNQAKVFAEAQKAAEQERMNKIKERQMQQAAQAQGNHSSRDSNVAEEVKQYIEKYGEEGLEEIQDALLDKETTNEKARLFIKGGKKDIDLLEQIL